MLFKRLVRLVLLLCFVAYVWGSLNLTLVQAPTAELRPSIRLDDQLVIRNGWLPEPGGLAAVKRGEILRIGLTFARGPLVVDCFRQQAVLNGQVLKSTDAIELEDGVQQINVQEQWPETTVSVRRRDLSLPMPLSNVRQEIELKAGELLLGCQDRIVCEGCGFEKVSQKDVLGTVFPLPQVAKWLFAL